MYMYMYSDQLVNTPTSTIEYHSTRKFSDAMQNKVKIYNNTWSHGLMPRPPPPPPHTNIGRPGANVHVPVHTNMAFMYTVYGPLAKGVVFT